MKKIYLVMLLNTIILNLNAQTFQWAKREGLYAYDYGYSVHVDNSGNVIVAGKYEEAANFSGTILPCEGNHDIFLVDYSPTGTMNWVRTAGGVLGDYAHCMDTDGSSKIYVAGEIEGIGDTIFFPGSPITLTAVGDNDAFLATYDINGTLKWAISEGWWRSEKALGVTYDASGNVYITGYFTDTTRWNGSVVPGNGGHEMFLAKYDSTGAFQWMKHAGGPGRDEGLSVKCDAAGNIYVCGMASDSAVFGSTIFNMPTTSSGSYLDGFIAKYAPDGTILWAKQMGGDYDDVAWSTVIDNAGTIYIAGEYNAYATFGATALSTSGHADVFVASMDNAGNFNWAVKAGGSLLDRARGIGTDGTNLFITGQYGGTANFGSTTITAADSSDIFMAELNNSGTFQWATTVGGTPDSVETLGYESGVSITADASGYVYATGTLLNNGFFGTTALTTYNRTDMFITKLALVGATVPYEKLNNVKVYPNPSDGRFSVVFENPSSNIITITNDLGQVLTRKSVENQNQVELDLTGYDTGIYFVEIKENEKAYRTKIIKQ